jgi:hypothetical protein
MCSGYCRHLVKNNVAPLVTVEHRPACILYNKMNKADCYLCMTVNVCALLEFEIHKIKCVSQVTLLCHFLHSLHICSAQKYEPQAHLVGWGIMGQSGRTKEYTRFPSEGKRVVFLGGGWWLMY